MRQVSLAMLVLQLATPCQSLFAFHYLSKMVRIRIPLEAFLHNFLSGIDTPLKATDIIEKFCTILFLVFARLDFLASHLLTTRQINFLLKFSIPFGCAVAVRLP